MAFTEAQIDAACAAWDRVWMGCAYQGMARDAIRAALIAAMDLVERHDGERGNEVTPAGLPSPGQVE
jgi:hypothetical protein